MANKNLTKVTLAIGAPPTIFRVLAVDRFEGTYGPSVTFEGEKSAVTTSVQTAENQLSRHNLSIEESVGQVIRFSKVAGGKSGYVNLDPTGEVPAAGIAPSVTPPRVLPFDEPPVFDELGNPVWDDEPTEGVTYAPLTDANAQARQTIVTRMGECMEAAHRFHAKIETQRASNVDIGNGKTERMSDYTFDGNAVARLASTMLIQMAQSRCL